MLVLKEEFVGCEKYRRAYKLGGGDAIVMWLALKCYASQHPSSEGFIPDEDINDLAGVPRSPRKALRALVECGGLMPDGTRGAGLVDPAPGGWRLHDYLDHSQTPEEIELRREKARQKKARQRAEKRRELEQVRTESITVYALERGTPGDSGGHVPGDTLASVRPPAHVSAPARVHALARPQPNPAQPNPLCPDREAGRNETRENDASSPPATPERTGQWWLKFPKGWREWSLETAAEAVALGLTRHDLGGHVDYWSLRRFPGGSVDDLDGELRRALPGIAERKRMATERGAAPEPAASSNPYAWAPTAEHRAFATARSLDLQSAATAYRATGIPDRLGTLRAHDDFMRRLRWWADHGGDFPASGKLPRVEASPEQRTAVGA